MSKKFSIAKAVELNKLRNEILDYEAKTGERNPYIFANKEIISAMAESCNVDWFRMDISKIPGRVAMFEYSKVFCDEDLAFGEVELR